jgi:RNA polymerase sigma factor (sigma-70 family)
MDQLVASHLPGARHHARQLASTCRGRRFSVEDLTQEALIGLLRAIGSFDRSAQYRFDAYAEIRMRQAVDSLLAEDAKRRREPPD